MVKKKAWTKYDEAFKRKAVDRVLKSGETITQVAADNEITHSMLHRWILNTQQYGNPSKIAAKQKARKYTRQLKDAPDTVPAPDTDRAVKVAAVYLKNAIDNWYTPRCRPLVELAFIELEEAL